MNMNDYHNIIIYDIIIIIIQPLVVPWPLFQFLNPVHSW
jgi:hypothetical protein